jgi:hypothetical protein
MQTIHPSVTGRAAGDNGWLLPARAVLARYGIVDRTLDRWLGNERLGFPRPLYVNRRRYFFEAELDRWERDKAAKSEGA